MNPILYTFLILGQIACAFYMGYTFAMIRILRVIRMDILPETHEGGSEEETRYSRGKIDGRMEVLEELHEVTRPPFHKK